MKNIIPRKYFEVWGDEQSQNLILKGLLAFLSLILIAAIISLTVLANKKPLIISVDKEATKLKQSSRALSQSLIDREVKQAVERFVKLRHNWTDKTIESNIKKSGRFISSTFKVKFLKANLSNIKAAKKKKITQRFYISSPIEIDERKKEIQVTGDRILIVEGLRATQPMTFRLTYRFGNRTPRNSEGVYITSETLISSLSH